MSQRNHIGIQCQALHFTHQSARVVWRSSWSRHARPSSMAPGQKSCTGCERPATASARCRRRPRPQLLKLGYTSCIRLFGSRHADSHRFLPDHSCSRSVSLSQLRRRKLKRWTATGNRRLAKPTARNCHPLLLLQIVYLVFKPETITSFALSVHDKRRNYLHFMQALGACHACHACHACQVTAKGSISSPLGHSHIHSALPK